MKQQLELIAAGRASEEILEKQLDASRREIGDAFEAWARQLGNFRVLVKSRGPARYPVQAATEPKGRTVYYISAFKHDLLVDSDDVSRWTALPAQGEDLGGNFFFGVEGSRGKVGTKERHRITNARTDDRRITIRLPN